MISHLKAGFALATLMVFTAASPTAARGQATPKTVTCTDGTTSTAGRGACSGHGGVAPAPAKTAPSKAAPTKAAPAKAAPAATAPAKTAPAKAAPAAPAAKAPGAPPATAKTEGPATAKCKDGTLSYAKSHTGACSKHGGVAEWLDGTKKQP
jgi:hypothetical protein